ncbi:MAG: hypothetical protein LBH36_01925 [Candidatus Nomurabacteria bacterium]|jgi:hypothetical protein|nr:hypothetical protein [Candidatus Nomurabacteria bacterium]
MSKKHFLNPLHHKKTESSKLLLMGDVLGWVGAVALLAAYLLASMGVIEGQSLAYQLLNIVGALGMLVLSTIRHAIPSAALNTIWFAVGIIAIFNLFIN